MKFMKLLKDGGPESKVWAFFLIEIKPLFSIAILHFHPGSRDAYHTHAFHAISWLLKGTLFEFLQGKSRIYPSEVYQPSLTPIITERDRFHQVVSLGHSYALTFRGPWKGVWKEYIPDMDQFIRLTHGRRKII